MLEVFHQQGRTQQSFPISAELLLKYKYDYKLETLMDILNMMTDHDLESITLHNFSIGECVQY